jgi:hypothetical protein
MSQADEDEMNEPDRQVALALAALSIAFVRVLQDLAPDHPEGPLVLLQRKMQIEQTRLRQTQGAETAAAMFRFVIKALREPHVIQQPED